MEDTEVYPLDEAAIQFIAVHDAEIAKLQARVAGMLDYFASQHKLQGSWRMAENKRELVKNTSTPMHNMTAEPSPSPNPNHIPKE